MHDHPPTLEEYNRIMADRDRPLTADPIGAHQRPGVDNNRARHTPDEPDTLRRHNIPVDGERTPQQAARLRELKERQ